MASPLRSFVQFAPLERKLRQLEAKSSDWKAQIKAITGPPLVEYELAKARRWDGQAPEVPRLRSCLDVVTAPGNGGSALIQADLLRFQALLLDNVGAESEFRRRPAPRISEAHGCLEPEAVPRALARFFEWTTSQAFAEMHAIEQMTLCQVRLYEIRPFDTYSSLTADFFSLRVLYLKTSLLPLFAVQETHDFEEALSQALGFVTKPLVDFYLRACERGCDQMLRQL